MKRVSRSKEAPQRENETQLEAWLRGSRAEGFEPALESCMRRFEREIQRRPALTEEEMDA